MDPIVPQIHIRVWSGPWDTPDSYEVTVSTLISEVPNYFGGSAA